MNRTILVLTGVLACAAILPAQNNPITENKATYETIKTNILKSAEKMPAEAYTFQPVPEERTWAALMGHIADAQTRICSSAAGSPKPATAGKLTGKDELVKALQDSFAVCDDAWASTTTENAHSTVKMGPREMSRISTLIYNTTHDNESYGTMAVYMRLKGVVPPSSEKK